MYIGTMNDKVFDELEMLKYRLKEAIEKTVDYHNVNARFTLRLKRERYENYVFEPAMMKFRRISSGTSVTLSGDLLHIALAEFPDVSNKFEKVNKQLIEIGIPPVPIPDPSNPGEYILRILELYEKIEGTGIRVKLP